MKDVVLLAVSFYQLKQDLLRTAGMAIPSKAAPVETAAR